MTAADLAAARALCVSEDLSTWSMERLYGALYRLHAVLPRVLDEYERLGAILAAQESLVGPAKGDDPIAIALRWNGHSGTREPDFDLNPEDTASFLAFHVIRLSAQLATMTAARDEACDMAQGYYEGQYTRSELTEPVVVDGPTPKRIEALRAVGKEQGQ